MSSPETINENSEPSEQNDTNTETSFFPDVMLVEEQRLKEENEKDDEKKVVEKLDDKVKKERLQSLLELLKNSSNLSDRLDYRLKKWKQNILKQELENVEAMKENEAKSTDTTIDQPNEKIIDEEHYLNLFKQPKLFNGHLKTHQVEGLLWIRTLYEHGLNGILADDMGLGKTIQTIAFYCFLIEMGVPGPFLVIAPLSTIPNWLSEFVQFSPQVSTLLYHGSRSQRDQIRLKFKNTTMINNLKCYPVVITTYDIVRSDVSNLRTINWKYVTIDEGHMLKNINTAISKCMRLFNFTNKLILTGTPIQNDMSELWSLLNLLMPTLFDKLENFNSWFTIEDFFVSNDKIASMAKENEVLNIMLKILKPFILRREKKDTDLNLPPKKEIVIYAPMTEKQQELYKATLNKQMELLLDQKKESDNIIHGVTPKRKCVQRIEKYTEHNAVLKDVPEPEVESKTVAISLVMQNPFVQLKKIANHPYLVHMPLVPGTNKILVDENIVENSGKFLVLDAMLAKLKLLGHKVLIFSTMTQILDLVEDFLLYRSYKYTRLDGKMEIACRVNAMKEFNVDPECFLMIISTRAGGLGLNLTSADTVIIFDSDWNPQCDLQAQDRCHRIGQDRPVVVYRLCSKNTVDERILARASAKRKLEKIIMGNGSFNKMTTKINTTEIQELMHLLESSEYNKKIQSNGYIFTDEELTALLDRSDMCEAKCEVPKSAADHFKVLTNSND